jgi:hypothetical protein
MPLPMASPRADLVWLSDKVREFGIHVVANRGAGKSRFLGRYLAFSDFLREVPTIVFDNRHTIDNFLDKVSRLPEEQRKALWPRIRYIHLAGLGGYVVPLPLYYTLAPDEDPLTTADRFVEVILKTEPGFSRASIQGKTAIENIAQPMGVELIQRGWQLTELDRLTVKIPPTLKVKLNPLIHSETQRAIYGAAEPGIDWQEVIDKKQIVLIDYRQMRKPQFALVWILDYLLSFIEARGPDQSPISIIVDELKAFKAAQVAGDDIFFEFLDVLVNTTMRGHNLWLTLAHQSMMQFDERVGEVLMSMDTQIIGKAGSMRSAVAIAQELVKIDPYKIKRYRPTFGQESYFESMLDRLPAREYFVLHQEPVEFTPGDQIREEAYRFQKLPTFTFLLFVKDSEPKQFSIANLEPGIFPDQTVVPAIRQKLMQRDGRKIEDVLAEIAARTAAPVQAKETKEPSTAKKLPVSTKGTLP